MATKTKTKATADPTPEQTELLKNSLLQFKRPDLLTQIKYEFDKDHIGDNKEKMFVFCSECSSQLPPEYRFSTALAGYSSIGKTDVWRTTSKHLPRPWYLDLTRATKATLEDDIHNVNLIYFGEGDANESIIETIKQLVEDGISAMKKDLRNDNKSMRHEVQPRKVGIYSTTKDTDEIQLASRYCKATITGSPSKYRMVNDSSGLIASDVALEYEKMIRDAGKTWVSAGLEQLQPVDMITIPYAEYINVYSEQARTMRDYKRFLNLIRVIAWLHQHNRMQFMFKGKKCMMVSIEDYWNAREIGDEIFSETLSGIEPRLQAVINSYYKLIKETNNTHKFERDGKTDTRYDNELTWIDRTKIQDDLKIKSRDTIRDHVKALTSMGLFTSVYLINQTFIASRYKSSDYLPTNYQLITDERKAFYDAIRVNECQLVREKLVGKLVGRLVGKLVGSPICRADLLTNISRLPTNVTQTRALTTTEKKLKAAISSKLVGKKLVGKGEEDTHKDAQQQEKTSNGKKIMRFDPAELKKWLRQNTDDNNEISPELLTRTYSDGIISGLHQSGLIKMQSNGNYKFVEVID